jgi:archaemetzincin
MPPEVVAAVQGAVAVAFDAQAVVGPTFREPPSALDVARGQYLADAVLREVPLPDGAAFSLGLVTPDLFTNGLSFVFGMAFAQRALVSIYRLASDEQGPRGQARFLLRVVTEAIHEVGHLFGLGHCRDRDCAMFFSNTLADTDRKGPALCHHCRAVLHAARP